MKQKRKRFPRWILFPAGLFFIFLFLFYGPLKSFRYLWINTAMYSAHHKYLARMFYTANYINKVLSLNEQKKDLKTDASSLTNAWDDKIEYAQIKGDYYKGYIIKINDPRRLILAQASETKGNLLEDLVLAHGAMGGINASGYRDAKERGLVWGTTIIDRKLVNSSSNKEKHIMGGLNAEYKLVVGHFTQEEIIDHQFLWALEFGPLLIVNGEKTELTSFSGGLAPRTAIGQTKEGHMLLVVADGRQKTSIGATFLDMQTILFANGAVNAINLDGGSSSSMVYQGALVNNPSDGKEERLLPNAIVFH